MDKDKRRGIIGTIAVHIIVLLCLFFFALRTPLPLPGEEGIEVNFGNDESAFGEVQTDSPPPVSDNGLPPHKVVFESAEDEEYLSQNLEETPAIEEKKKPAEVVKKEPEPQKVEKPVEEPIKKSDNMEKTSENPKPTVNTKALYTGSSNKSKTGTNQGIGEGEGDMGKPTGYKDSDNYDGQGGSGNGISYSLGGRGAKYIEKPSSNFSETATVVVTIWVDRNGIVQRAQVNPKGTTTVDANMKKIALDAAKNSTFEADQSAADLQTGTITYKFVLLK